MRKYLLAATLLLTVSSTAQAGGILTNSNQSVQFLRNPARDAHIAIDGAYVNPAGIGFLSNGWHLGFDWQSAYQTRTVATDFPYFHTGMVNGVANPAEGVKKFKGHAKAPVIPSLDLARVGDKWFASFHFGITGGGGKCIFDDGLGTFESQTSFIPVLIGALMPEGVPSPVSGYSIDSYMQGRQYYFGGQFGVGYKINPHLNVSAGMRVVYADCNYYGYVRNIGVRTAAGTVPAKDFFENMNMPHFAALVTDRELNCDQTGWGFTPIISADYRIGDLNLAARYEFKTRMRLKNRAGVNTSGISEYDDGKRIAADIPAILALGAMYSVTDDFRVSTGFHYYFDKQARQYEERNKRLDGGTWEVLAGMEYDINKRWRVSAGWQTTNYGLGKNSGYISDISFVTSSNSVGLGARFQLRKKVALNLAYFKTFYRHYKKDADDYVNIKGTMSGMMTPLAGQLAAGKTQYEAVLGNPDATPGQKEIAAQQLSVINTELGAIGSIAAQLPSLPTGAYENFHRTNDVFGLGLEIDF